MVIFSIAFTLLNLLFTIRLFYGNQFLPLILLIELLVTLAGIWLLNRMIKTKKPIEKIFAVFALTIGLLFVIFLPTGQTPDESVHAKRAYMISQGGLIAQKDGDAIAPCNFPEDFSSAVHIHAHGTYYEIANNLFTPIVGESEEPCPAAAAYHFVMYLPQALGMVIGRGLRLSLTLTLYLGRVFNLLFYVLLVYFAIKLIPKFKEFLFFVALLPMTMQQAASLSPDAMTIGVAFLIIGHAAYLIYEQKKRLQKKDIVLMFILATILGFCKIVYLPLCLMYLLVPHEKFGSKRQKWVCILCGILVVLGLNAAWVLSQSVGAFDGPSPGGDIDVGRQLSQIMANPLKYIAVIFETIFNDKTDMYIGTAYGMNLGWFAINLPRFYFYAAIVMTVLILSRGIGQLKVRFWERTTYIICVIVPVLAMATLMYLAWTEVGSGTIEGIQGRYFIPLLPLAPFVISGVSKDKRRTTPLDWRYIVLYCLFMNICAVVYCFGANA